MTASSSGCVVPRRTCCASSEKAHVQPMAIAAPESRKMPNTVYALCACRPMKRSAPNTTSHARCNRPRVPFVVGCRRSLPALAGDGGGELFARSDPSTDQRPNQYDDEKQSEEMSAIAQIPSASPVSVVTRGPKKQQHNDDDEQHGDLADEVT